HATLRQVEVLASRESHGAEIRNPAWRKQFANRNGLSELVFRTDIKNISGATLSSEHVTQGVRWLVALWETALRSPPNTAAPTRDAGCPLRCAASCTCASVGYGSRVVFG